MGIFCNVFLFVVKFAVGLVAHSVSVMADAFNNLSDAGSSIISFVGVKMAEKPADEDHPFGHGRIEYIAALVVSFIVLEVVRGGGSALFGANAVGGTINIITKDPVSNSFQVSSTMSNQWTTAASVRYIPIFWVNTTTAKVL